MHRYEVTVYALDVATVGLEPGFTLSGFRRAIEDHVLDRATIVPSYTLNPSLREGGP